MRLQRVVASCIPLLAAASLSAQAPDPNDPRAAVTYGLNEVTGWVTKAADMVPADKYTYKPVKTVRSFGELIAHVVDGSNFYCGQVTGKNPKWSDANEKGKTDKATVVPKLKAAFDACKAAYATGKIAPAMANVAHTNLHYGNIITYMRMMGLVPPSTGAP